MYVEIITGNSMKVKEFSPPKKLKTPVLFLVFNRLDTTIQVFESIRKAKPLKLYIASDGPRDEVEGESQKVRAVRDYLSSNVDWDCEVKTLFRDKNLGCKYAVSGSIDWFFQNEEKGIILEDDCLPTQSFFWYCEELLIKYNGHPKIKHISGTNVVGKSFIKNDFYFSRYSNIWGWATWRTTWQKFNIEMSSYNFENIELPFHLNFFNNCFKDAKLKLVDTWDYQYNYVIIENNYLSVIPKYNLIKNIGFHSMGTHTNSIPFNKLKFKTYDYKINSYPNRIKINRLQEMLQFFLENFSLKQELKRIIKKS